MNWRCMIKHAWGQAHGVPMTNTLIKTCRRCGKIKQVR